MRSRVLLRWSIAITALLVVSGWARDSPAYEDATTDNAQSTLAPRLSVFAVPNGRTVTLGQGFNSLTGELLSRDCVSGPVAPYGNDLGPLAAFGTVQSGFQEIQSASDFSTFLGLGLTASTDQVAWSASVDAKYESITRSSSRSHTAAGRVEVFRSAEGMGSYSLSRIVSTEKADSFFAKCGDYFISEIVRGAHLTGVVSKKAQSEYEYAQLNAVMAGQAKGYGKGALQLDAQALKSQWAQNAEVTYSGHIPLSLRIDSPQSFLDALVNLPALVNAGTPDVVAFAIKPYTVVNGFKLNLPDTRGRAQVIVRLEALRRTILNVRNDARLAHEEFGTAGSGLTAAAQEASAVKALADLDIQMATCRQVSAVGCLSIADAEKRFDFSSVQVVPRLRGYPIQRADAPPNQDNLSIGPRFHANTTVVAGATFYRRSSDKDTELFATSDSNCQPVNTWVVFASGFQNACSQSIGFVAFSPPTGIPESRLTRVLVNQDQGLVSVHAGYSADLDKTLSGRQPSLDTSITIGSTPFKFVGYLLKN